MVVPATLPGDIEAVGWLEGAISAAHPINIISD